MNTRHVIKNGYQVATCLASLVNKEILPELEISEHDFWSSVADILDEFIPRNKQLLDL